MIICTSICANYLPKAMVLAKSLKKTNPKCKMLVCLLEKEIHKAASECEYFDYIVLSKDMGFENFPKTIFKRTIVEASTAVKGQLFVYMLNEFKDENKFVYLDPDIQVISELKELDEALDVHPAVLTPHLCAPEDTLDAVMDNELCALQHGVFNLGFLAIKRSEEGKRVAEWWANRLEMFCYDDIPRGVFMDQKWFDLAPCYFDILIFKHPGYNAAAWNLSKRTITYENGKYMVNGKPLRFYHFSGFDSGANEIMINKYVPDKSNSIYDLRKAYVKEMNNFGQADIGKTPWSYDYFDSGEKIDSQSRIIYRDNEELQYKYLNPFVLSNSSFCEEEKKSKLLKPLTVVKKIKKKLFMK